MRPRYETDSDRRRQWDAVTRLCAAMGTVPRITPELAPWDYSIHRGEQMVAIVEVKCRLCASRTYPTYMIGTRKMETLQSDAVRLGVPGLLLVGWSDVIGVVSAAEALARGFRSHGGRSDRDDPLDTETVLHVPVEMFQLL
jgi:hypothetical protein